MSEQYRLMMADIEAMRERIRELETQSTQAHAAGRRAGLEEAAKIAEDFVITPTDYIRDADTCFDIAMKIHAKAKEGT